MTMTEEHAPAAPHQEHAHPGARRYIQVAVTLAVFTAVEVAISYTDVTDIAKRLALSFLMVVKFALVAMFFMHLRFDSRVFTVLFIGGLALAMIVFTAVLTISRVFFV